MAFAASATGGKAFYGTNGIAAAIQKVIDDFAGAYVIGYYPGEDYLIGGFHTIRINTKRSGLPVRAKEGYCVRDNSEPTGE